MISINATIIVQIFNFLIGYFLISKFLLKPAYDVLKREEQYVDVLSQAVNDEVVLVKNKEESNRSDWIALQHYFHEHKPQIGKPREPLVKKNMTIHAQAISAEKMDNAKKEIIKTVEAKILSAI